MPTEQTPASPSRVDRRAVVKGAAWTVPLAAASVAAPAYASSSECVPQTAAAVQTSWQFNGSIAAWSSERTPTTAPQVEYSANYSGLGPGALVVADPPAGTASVTTLRSPIACLGPGTYQFAFNSRLYNANPRNLTLQADVVNATTNAVVSANTISFTTNNGTASTQRTNDVVTVTVGVRTSVRFRYRWSFTATGSGAGDDIAVSAPTVTRA